MLIYQTEITKIGPLASEFIEADMLILFKTDAPAELADYCLLHEQNELNEDISAGDTLYIGEQPFRILEVGEAVNKNLAALGHITIRHEAGEEENLPGTLVIEQGDIPALKEGATLTIKR